ncbi:NADH(P)-binding family protein, partial [Medicago truncatula]
VAHSRRRTHPTQRQPLHQGGQPSRRSAASKYRLRLALVFALFRSRPLDYKDREVSNACYWGLSSSAKNRQTLNRSSISVRFIRLCPTPGLSNPTITPPSSPQERIVFVIFGASGNVGQSTVTTLRNAGHPVRAVLRDARHRERFAQLGCDVVIAELTDVNAVASAIDGAQAVQILCPVPVADPDPAATMTRTIDVATAALAANPPPALLALSDYGAEREGNTGITRLFHYLEERLRTIPTQLTLLRSAEHLQNWARVLP